MNRRRGAAGIAAAVVVAAGLSANSPAETLDAQELRAGQALATSCFDGVAPDAAHTDAREFAAPFTGFVSARLSSAGDWDLAVYDAATGQVVAGSAGFAGNELAEGYVTSGQLLLVQGCRYRGDAATAALRVEFFAQPAPTDLTGVVPPIALLAVSTPTRADRARLQTLGLDLTEAGNADHVQVLAHGTADLRSLTEAGLDYTVLAADLAARQAVGRGADARAAESRSALPSGSATYRRLFDYELEMKQLAAQYNRWVRPLTLPNRSVAGRDVEGIEITRNADRVADGKPVFVVLGLHHAREWPAGEHSLEFAYDLLRNRDRPEIIRLLSAARVIVVPVVNPDGFTISREAPTIGQSAGLGDYELKRKNCRATDLLAPADGSCGAALAGAFRGVDLNRNYGGFWGGPGSSALPVSEIYRGPGPFSEPEIRNVRDLLSGRQVTVAVSNHTYGGLVLYPPGTAGGPAVPDAARYAALGERLARHTGYLSHPAYKLYDVTGVLEDWAYWNLGTLAFTIEIGGAFHPRYDAAVINEYLPHRADTAIQRAGTRAIFYDLLRAAADPDLYVRIRGRAPRGTVLRLYKSFETPTSAVQGPLGIPGEPIHYPDTVVTLYRSQGGRFEIAANPSTRPYVQAFGGSAGGWRLTCEAADGRVLAARTVTAERGETVQVGTICHGEGRSS